jgi:hypothetical protein
MTSRGWTTVPIYLAHPTMSTLLWIAIARVIEGSISLIHIAPLEETFIYSKIVCFQ